MDRPAVDFVRVGRLAEPVDQRKAARIDRGGAGVGDCLLRGDQVIGIDAIFDAERLPGRVRPAQRYRRRRGQLRTARGPHGVRVRHLDALRRPAEAREIGGLGPARREQAHRGRILLDRLAIFAERDVVDARADEVDRPLDRGGFDRNTPAFGEHRVDRADRLRGGRGGRTRGRQRARLALRRGRRCGRRAVCARDRLGHVGRVGGRKIFLRNEVPADQYGHRQQNRRDQVTLVVHALRSLFVSKISGMMPAPKAYGTGS